jgi:hypothetical protein
MSDEVIVIYGDSRYEQRGSSILYFFLKKLWSTLHDMMLTPKSHFVY